MKNMTVFFSTCFAALVLSACGQGPDEGAEEISFGVHDALSAHKIDAEWYEERLDADVLQPWSRVISQSNGFVPNRVTRDWKPVEGPTSLVAQTRGIYVLAKGYQITSDDVFLLAMINAADVLLERFTAPQLGQWYRSVDPQSGSVNRSPHPYGYAFAILALANAYEASGDERYRNAAFNTWLGMDIWVEIEKFSVERGAGGGSQNPLMHLFEAVLELHRATNSRAVLESARTLADFIFTHLYESEQGYIPEYFVAGWEPSPKGHIDLGHQVEWAYLLSEGVHAGLPTSYIDIGNRLLDYALDAGYSVFSDGLASKSDYSGEGYGHKGWWQQAEFLRALLRYASVHDRKDLWSTYDRSFHWLKNHFIDETNGGWFEKPVEPGSASDNKQAGHGYHVVNLYVEALRIGGVVPRS